MNHEHLLTASVAVNVVLIVYCVYVTWWSAQREQHLRDVSRKVIAAINKTNLGYGRIVRAIKQSHGLSKSNRKEILDVIRETKRDQTELVLDVEDRLSRSIERRHDGTQTNVQVTGGGQNYTPTKNIINGDQATIAQGQNVQQARE